MRNKTDYILNSMIRAYLNEQNPIGSMLLQDSLNMPASTIRVYFKQLDSDGLISKLHASGGRIPTKKAMQNYWREFFANNDVFVVKNKLELLRLASENELFCCIIDSKKVFLNDVVNVNNSFLLLDFVNNQLCVDYSSELKNLFTELIGCELNDIKTILYRLNLLDLLNKIDILFDNKMRLIYGERVFANIVKLCSFRSLFGVRLLDYFTQDVIFDELFLPENMGVRLECLYDNSPSSLILAGSIFRDYESILTKIKEAV